MLLGHSEPRIWLLALRALCGAATFTTIYQPS